LSAGVNNRSLVARAGAVDDMLQESTVVFGKLLCRFRNNERLDSRTLGCDSDWLSFLVLLQPASMECEFCLSWHHDCARLLVGCCAVLYDVCCFQGIPQNPLFHSRSCSPTGLEPGPGICRGISSPVLANGGVEMTRVGGRAPEAPNV
jgi:hypothetical protein